jgi:hypothetical protein
MRQILFLAALSCGLAACPGADSNPKHALLYTGLEGTVLLPDGVAEVEVCAYQMGDGGISAKPEGCATSDARGFWMIKGGSLSDSIYLVAKTDDSEFRLSATATNVEQYEQAASIHIHPISHLTAGYALHLLGQGKGARPAIELARTALNLHFGGLPHHHIQPWTAPPQASSRDHVALSGSVKAYLITAGLDTLARRMSSDSGVTENTAVTQQTLLAALYDDISSDGLFDGIGTDGVQLTQLQSPLSPHTLRLDLAIAMAQFLRSPINPTDLTDLAVKPILEALAASQGRIFPDAGVSYNASVPELSSCTVWREDKQVSLLDHPQRGLIEVHCAWSDRIGLEATSMWIQSEGGNGALRLIDEPTVALAAVIDTQQLADGVPHKLVVQATNKSGATSTVNLTLEVDNTPLSLVELDRGSKWSGAENPFRVSGSVDKPLRRAVLTPGEFAPVTREYAFEDQVYQFDVSYPKELPCNREYGLRIELEDWTGDIFTQTIIATCDGLAPRLSLIPQTFTHELAQNTVDLWNWSAENPLTFEKFYNRLDYLPGNGLSADVQNLPVLTFRVNDKDELHPGAAADELRVEYSYVMNQDPARRRGWQTLSADEEGIYRLPVSYQSLLPVDAQIPQKNFIARSQPTDRHEISIRVTDPAGNQSTSIFPFYLHLLSPPVSVSNCGPSGSLLGASLVHPNFDVVFSPNFDLFNAYVDHRVEVPARSLAPRSGVVLKMEREPLETAITHVKYSRGFVGEARPGREMVIDTRRRDAALRISQVRSAVRERGCDRGRRLVLEDGKCQHLSRSLQYPFTKVDEKGWQSTQAVNVVTFMPSGFAASMDNGHVEVLANSSYLMRTRMQGEFRLENGRFLQWQSVPDSDGTLVVEMDHEFGMEVTDNAEKLFEVRHSIAGLKMSSTPLRVSVMRTLDGMPLPVGVDVDASCSQPIELTWSASP